MTELAPALRDYVEAYGAGDRDRLVGAFAEDANVRFAGPPGITGQAAIREAHVRIGTFNFHVDQVHTIAADRQAIEGRMIAKRAGAELTELAVPFAAFAELTGSGKIKQLRFYYDGSKVRAAIEVADKPE